MSDLTIFGFAESTYVRTVRLACEEKGVPYTLSPMRFDSPELADVHPFRKIPAMRHGEVALYESAAICRYVDSAFDGPSLTPDDAAGAALMEQWISVINAYVDPPMIRAVVMERVVKPRHGGVTDERRCAEAKPLADRALEVLDARLAGSEFLAGAPASIADFFLVPILFYYARMPEGDGLKTRYPGVGRWFDAMAARPSFRATHPGNDPQA